MSVERKVMSDFERRYFTWLCGFTQRTGRFPSRRFTAKELNCTQSRVQKLIKKMIEKGYLYRTDLGYGFTNDQGIKGISIPVIKNKIEVSVQ